MKILILALTLLLTLHLFPQSEAPKTQPEKEQSPQETENQEPAKSAEELAEEKRKAEFEAEKKKIVSIWERDSQTILGIIGEFLLASRENMNATELQKIENKKQFKQKLKELNKKYYGATIKLERVILSEVNEETRFTDYGKKYIKKIISELKGDPSKNSILLLGEDISKNIVLGFYLMSQIKACQKCEEKTGYFEAIYEIPMPTFNELENRISYSNTGIKLKICDTKYCYINSSDRNYCEGVTDDYCGLLSVKIKKTIKTKQKALSLEKGKIYHLNSKISYFNENMEMIIDD